MNFILKELSEFYIERTKLFLDVFFLPVKNEFFFIFFLIMEGAQKKPKYILPDIKDAAEILANEEARQKRELTQVLWEVYNFEVQQQHDMKSIFRGPKIDEYKSKYWIGPYGIFVPRSFGFFCL